jgi:hypothetical protein
MRPYLSPCLVVVAVLACSRTETPHTAAPQVSGVHHEVTAAMLDSLPQLKVVDGQLVCLAVKHSPCPADLATANWLHDGKFATWELNRPVQIWTPGKVDPQTLGEVGPADSQYSSAMSVAARGKGYVVLDGGNLHALDYDAKGRFTGAVPIPKVSITHAAGYAGDIAVLQLIHSVVADSPADFEIREVDTPGDTVGHLVLSLKLPWLRIRDNHPSVSLPLFPTLPAYSIAADSDIIWTAGDTFAVRRQSPAGVVRWAVTSNVPGAVIGTDEVAGLRQRVLAQGNPQVLANFDSAAAHTGKNHAAIAGLLVAADGKVLVAGPQLTTRETVDAYLLDATGKPTGRFTLPRQTHVLLFAGDSLLVQRSGANSQPELRWMVLKKS